MLVAASKKVLNRYKKYNLELQLCFASYNFVKDFGEYNRKT